MKTRQELVHKLNKMDGAGYKAYKDITGVYEMGDFTLFIDHVQADPFAPPSKIRARVAKENAGFPDYLEKGVRGVALADLLARYVGREIEKRPQVTGKSGLIRIDAGRQQVLKRSAVKIAADFIEARMEIGLPAQGRRIQGRETARIFGEQLPRVIRHALFFSPDRIKEMEEHVFLYEDQEFIRDQLNDLGLVAFIADGSILPRLSGDSDLPLPADQAIPFKSPPEMQVELKTLNHSIITGMGIPSGITLVVGGGYHGKTTLLRAIERGVYNHIGGDGWEWVVTVKDAVKIRAEDGRSIKGVDIKYFIDNLPFGLDTRSFSSPNASGSTSQAANTVEALQCGATLLLIDEDTSATNFMIRDARMQRLVARDKEPIKPFIDRIKPLWQNHGISCILVIGGAGDYLDVADRVIMLDAYKVVDVTDKAREIARKLTSTRIPESDEAFVPRNRMVKNGFFRGLDGQKIAARGIYQVAWGRENIDLSAVEQLIDSSQTRAIAEALRYMAKNVRDDCSLTDLAAKLHQAMEEDLDNISPFPAGQHPGDLALPRKYEIAACLNRLRSIKIEQN
jgi:predicted ABC-class ATPase